ncbi:MULTISPECIES: CAF17-like 4Fe-4S cluster assembly/insertion protein YgfZ [Amycolatopsis]|uniref:Folate-binding protein YgfZ n=1 Tax=Amycolatopsis dendrobii TaxID=2760662 RepID=A0A7W3VZU6_9PSEU|nr:MULTISPECIES: folate-binding protein YgfZ [Amycolatopsis]MBB1155717.1 folate-binding protein YgfZ [Amycolatopsis dendrobii]UKD52921.1 folate-binding protein [Amycolatopsis sp. FU40]
MPYSSPLLEIPRAVAAPEGHPEAGVPWHWGDPFAEQRTAARGVVVIDRSHREILAVTGEERLSWLHLVISQHVTELAANTGTEALVLDSQGHVDTHFVLAHTGETVYLDSDPGPLVTSALPKGGKQTLREYLEAMKFWSKVEIRDATEELAVLSVLGPETDSVLGVELGTEPYSVAALPEGGFARRMPWPTRAGADLVVPRAQLTQWWQRLTDAGARPAGSWTFDALRVESRHPRLGVDTDERTIPHEVGWIGSAAHVAKGCYRGQETVSKVHNVGRPPRYLALLHLDGSPEITPETGDPVKLGERVVGRIGTVAQHHELGPIALALVKRSVPGGAELLAGDEDRVVQATVDPDSVPGEHAAPGREAAQRLRG